MDEMAVKQLRRPTGKPRTEPKQRGGTPCVAHGINKRLWIKRDRP